MKNSEKFTLAGGILAFVVDILTLGTFAGAVASTEIPLSLQVWVLLTMIYGWFIISWVLVRRNHLRHQRLAAQERVSRSLSPSCLPAAKPWSLEKSVLRVVTGIGCMLLPIAFLFGYPIIRREVPNPQFVLVDHFLTLFLVSVGALFLIGFVVSYAIHELMPVVYEEM